MANVQEDDEINKLPLKERLEYQKIQAETKALKKSIFTQPAFYGVVSPTFLALVIFLVTGIYSGWFDVKLGWVLKSKNPTTFSLYLRFK